MNQNYQQQQRMSEPPSIITNKDLLYLEDAMSWELLACKKAASYANECQDPQIQQRCDQMAQMHQHHYQMLLKHVAPQTQQENLYQYNQTSNQTTNN